MKIIKICVCILFLIVIFLITYYYISVNRLKKTVNNKMNLIQKKINDIDSLLNKDNIDIPFFYINLKRSPDRKKFMENQIKKYNISCYTRIDAVDSKLLDFKKTPSNVLVKSICSCVDNCICEKITCINNYMSLTNNEIACTLSHLKAIFTAYNMNYERVIITEDDADISLSKLWDFKLTEICNKAPENWEIIQLYNNCSARSPDMFIPFNLYHECWGAVAYIINRKGMKAILEVSLYPNVILGIRKDTEYNNINKRDKNIFPHMGVADFYLYQIANTYVLNKPIIFPNNYTDNMSSTLAQKFDINNDRDNFAMKSSNEIINSFIDKIRIHTNELNIENI